MTATATRTPTQLFRELGRRAIDVATSLGAQWADVRVGVVETEDLGVRNGEVKTLEQCETAGFGVRVLVDGAHGFASGYDLTPEEVERVARLALSRAKAGSLAPRSQRCSVRPARRSASRPWPLGTRAARALAPAEPAW